MTSNRAHEMMGHEKCERCGKWITKDDEFWDFDMNHVFCSSRCAEK